MVLIPDQKRKLLTKALHDVTTVASFIFLKLEGPVDEHTLDEEVEADQELDSLLALLNRVKPLSEWINPQDLARQFM